MEKTSEIMKELANSKKINVEKNNGIKERFSYEKLLKSLVMVETPFFESDKIVAQVVSSLYDGIKTKEIKEIGEKGQLELLDKYNIDFIVLARYMQIITPKLIEKYQNNIINIHHSFLPAFPGAKPYHSAFKRGVKIIGATSHYVTEGLDEGPIIEQDIARVTHSHSIEDFIMKGRDLERMVLARAIKLHAERKTMVYNNKTVVFL